MATSHNHHTFNLVGVEYVMQSRSQERRASSRSGHHLPLELKTSKTMVTGQQRTFAYLDTTSPTDLPWRTSAESL
jgi:hypothetical protein